MPNRTIKTQVKKTAITNRHLLIPVVAMAAALFSSNEAKAQACAGNLNVGCLHSGAICSPVDEGVGPTGHCVTPSGLPPGERECNCVGSPITQPDPCADRTATGKIVCRIDEPVVTQHETEYTKVVFVPNDIVEVEADGCVQTGGFGDTWKRYVNPSGPNSASLYHGLIRILTGTKDSALVRINTVIGRQLKITGTGVPESQLFLHLGYEDDGYPDNGYYSHDDGTEDQCKTDMAKGKDGGPAHVTVTIFRGVPPDNPSSRFNFDVLSNNLPDPNGLLYNPRWSWQMQPENAGQIPSTSMCHNFSYRPTFLGIPRPYLEPSFSDCTDQADPSTVDLPMGINGVLCDGIPFLNDAFAGHVNWFPVTVEGHGGWGDHGADDDYTFGFTSDEPGDPLSVNGRGGLHVEFDSDETIDHFGSDDPSGEWNAFHQAVDTWKGAQGALAACALHACTAEQINQLNQAVVADKQSIQTVFKGHMILTGMYGLDGEHGLKAEMHPLYAMADRRDNLENTPDDEAWLMFVRNQGDEGFCSSSVWDSGFEDYTVRLPWREGMTSVDVNWDKTKFHGTDGTSGPTVAAVPPPASPAPAPPPGVYVTFHLGPPVHSSFIFDPGASIPFVEGTLHLIWKGQPVVAGMPAPTAQAASEEEADDVEHMIETVTTQLPPAQQQKIQQARRIEGAHVAAVHTLMPTGPVQPLKELPATARFGGFHAIKAGPAIQKAARDEAQMRELCAATQNAPPGLPAGVCTGNTPAQH